MLRDERFYVPLIAAYSGMRLEEICQPRSEDTGVAEDVPCIFVRAGEGRRIKTANAHRAVPIHPVLVDAGLLEHRDRMAGDASGLLFSELGFTRDGQPSPLDPRERHGGAISTWFGHYCTRVGLSDLALVFHSFRHGFIGHESYFPGYAPGVLADTVRALSYGIEDEARAQLQNPRLSFAPRYPAARVRQSRGA
jgi:integrase